MTPRQIRGALTFAEKDARREAADNLALGAQASRGEPKELKRLIKDLVRE